MFPLVFMLILSQSIMNMVVWVFNPSLAVKLHMRNFSSASGFKCLPIGSKFGEKIVLVANSLDPDETPSYSASHPDTGCLHMEQ